MADIPVVADERGIRICFLWDFLTDVVYEVGEAEDADQAMQFWCWRERYHLTGFRGQERLACLRRSSPDLKRKMMGAWPQEVNNEEK